jgi:hypothetical protein
MDDVQRIADSLAQRISRPVAIDDPQMNLLAHTAHDGDVDQHRIVSVMRLRAPEEVIAHALKSGIATAVDPVRVPAVPEIDLYARICIPVRCQGVLLAFLWLIDADGSVTDEDLEIAVEAAGAAGEVLFRERLLGDLRESRQRELVRDLLSDDVAVRVSALGLLVEEEMLPTQCTLAALSVQVDDPDRDDVRTAIDTVLRRCGRRAQPIVALALPRGAGRGVLVLAGRRGPTEQQLEHIAQDVRSDLLKTLHLEDGVRVGIGPSVSDPLEVRSSVRRAQEALEVGAAVEGFGPVTAWSALGVYRLLVQLPLDGLLEDALPEGLRTLMGADAGGPLVETLETWLDEGCDPRATVARLQVHRTSLYYRLSRIEEITGMKLSDGRDRLALHLGLKLTRLRGR